MANLKHKDLLIALNHDKFIAIYENENKFYYLGEFIDANKAHHAVHKLGLNNATTIMRSNVSDEYDFNQMVKLIQSEKKRVYDLEEIMKIDIDISINKLNETIVYLEKLLENKEVPYENKEEIKDEIAEKRKLIVSMTERKNTEMDLEKLNPKNRNGGIATI